MADGLIQLGGAPQEEDPIVGIDLGTTNSLVAYVRDGKPEVLRSREGRNLVPSVVTLGAKGEAVIGYQAKHEKVRSAGQTVYSVKRLLGRGFEDLRSVLPTLPYQVVWSSEDKLPRIQL